MVERLGILSVRPKLRDMQWSVEIYNSIKDEIFLVILISGQNTFFSSNTSKIVNKNRH